MNQADIGLLKMDKHQSASGANARRIDGADAYGPSIRYDYLYGKGRMDQMGAFSQRTAEESGSGRARQLDPLPLEDGGGGGEARGVQ